MIWYITQGGRFVVGIVKNYRHLYIRVAQKIGGLMGFLQCHLRPFLSHKPTQVAMFWMRSVTEKHSPCRARNLEVLHISAGLSQVDALHNKSLVVVMFFSRFFGLLCSYIFHQLR